MPQSFLWLSGQVRPILVVPGRIIRGLVRTSKHKGQSDMGDVYQVGLQTRVDDKVCTVTLHYEQTAGTTGAQGAKQCCDSMLANLVPAFLDVLATDVDFQGVTARRIKPLPGVTGIGYADDSPGTVTGTALPAISCLVLNLRNGSGLLPRPGRVFISGCAKESMKDGKWLDAFLTGVVTDLGTAMLSVAAGGDGDFAGDLVVPRYVINQVPTSPPTIVPVTSIDFALEVGRQLRRKSRMIGG